MSGGGRVKTPADFLKLIRGCPVIVKLNSGVDYREMLGFATNPLSNFFQPHLTCIGWWNSWIIHAFQHGPAEYVLLLLEIGLRMIKMGEPADVTKGGWKRGWLSNLKEVASRSGTVREAVGTRELQGHMHRSFFRWCSDGDPLTIKLATATETVSSL